MKALLKEVPSGKIEIVNNGMQLHIEFNCSCEDAIPFCGGMCCGYRPSFNAQMSQSEELQFSYITLQHPHMTGKFIDYRPTDGRCVAHDEQTGFCRIQNCKPTCCQNWHCSPQGKGEGITRRANGWLLFPTQTT